MIGDVIEDLEDVEDDASVGDGDASVVEEPEGSALEDGPDGDLDVNGGELIEDDDIDDRFDDPPE
jgi:hypothetical protein